MAGETEEVELVVGAQSLKVDKKVLRKYSDYFEAMFSAPFAEDTFQKIKLQNLHFRSLKVIVDYMYSGRLGLNSGNIENVYLTADFLQINTVKSRCEELLPKHLDGYNCISIYNIAVRQGLHELESTAIKTMLRCFEQHFEDKDFLYFKVELLTALLCDLDLNISSELMVYETIKQWINHDPTNRLQFKGELMMCLKVELLSHHQLANIFISDFMKTEVALKMQLRNKLSENTDKSGRIKHERLGMIINRVYIMGGLSNKKVTKDGPCDSGRLVEVLCTGKSRDTPSSAVCDTKILSSWSPRLYGAGAVCVRNAIYIVGGTSHTVDRNSSSSKVWKFLPHSQIWVECSALPTSVHHLTVTCCDEKIYAVGGYETDHTGEKNISPSNKIQVYDIQTDMWLQDDIQLSEARAHASSVAQHSGGGLPGRIYVLGGYGKSKLNSVEFISGGKVSAFPPMLRARHAFAAGLVEGMIMVVGGWGDPTVERYDFRNKQWSMLTNFPRFRDCLQGVVCDGSLLVLGGLKSEKHITTVERYSCADDKWKTIAKLQIPRLYFSCTAT